MNKPAAVPKHLYVSVNTFDKDGHQVGHSVRDMYHKGTNHWLQKHMWWAAHNSCVVETILSSADEISQHLDRQAAA